MRSRHFLLVLTLGACGEDNPFAPVPPSVESAPLVAATKASTVPRIIACGGRHRPLGPLFIVNERIVADSVGRLAAATEGARVEMVPDLIAVQAYGSRASEGVFIVTLGASRVGAR